MNNDIDLDQVQLMRTFIVAGMMAKEGIPPDSSSMEIAVDRASWAVRQIDRRSRDVKSEIDRLRRGGAA